jgi:DNA-directed RNA polymerase beta subunit
MAKSNYTDDKGTLAMGINALVGLVPYKGHTMDDAIVISESFAKRLASGHVYGFDTDYKRGVKGGKGHYIGIFPNKYTNDQLSKLDDDGVAMKGQIINPGDPIILATKPRVISSTSAQLGLLSKHMRSARSDAVTTWDEDTPGKIEDVERTRSGVTVRGALSLAAIVETF